MREGGILVLVLKNWNYRDTFFFFFLKHISLPFLPFWLFCLGDPVGVHETIISSFWLSG